MLSIDNGLREVKVINLASSHIYFMLDFDFPLIMSFVILQAPMDR